MGAGWIASRTTDGSNDGRNELLTVGLILLPATESARAAGAANTHA
jgi:hypothetical protein